jgi:hypothetical protein
MIRDAIVVAIPPHKKREPEKPPAGVAIWAKVSDEVDAKIREQIKAGAFRVRLKVEDWDSGDIAWLRDVIAPTKEQASAVVQNFGQMVKDGKLLVHTGVTARVNLQNSARAKIEGGKAQHQADLRNVETRGGLDASGLGCERAWISESNTTGGPNEIEIDRVVVSHVAK